MPKLTNADIAHARQLIGLVEALAEGNDGSPSRILARYLGRALAELEAARVEKAARSQLLTRPTRTGYQSLKLHHGAIIKSSNLAEYDRG